MATKKVAKKVAEYYIVNPAGAVHGVDRAHAQWRLGQTGYRLATEAEVTAYKAARIQRADRPIAPRFTTDPDAALASLTIDEAPDPATED